MVAEFFSDFINLFSKYDKKGMNFGDQILNLQIHVVNDYPSNYLDPRVIKKIIWFKLFRGY